MTKAEKLRAYHREWARKKRADPEYRKRINARRRKRYRERVMGGPPFLGNKFKEGSVRYEKIANALARGYAPPIYPCQKCTYPVLSGHRCTRCGDGNPREPRKSTKEVKELWGVM